jgi:hypothetical protein
MLSLLEPPNRLASKVIVSTNVNVDHMKDIISYSELSKREGSIQRGINYRTGNKPYTVLLMSVREDAPYNDGFDEAGETLVYEGENVNTRRDARSPHIDPRTVGQPFFTKSGKLTNNGKLYQAAEDYLLGRRLKPERVRVYEKVMPNVWADKGWFHLVDAEQKLSESEGRKVFKFYLVPDELLGVNKATIDDFEFSRRIPTAIKRAVWERDDGKCVKCGIENDLHFDHIIPFSKGGSSTDPRNIQLLCSKHNLRKSDNIE